jgi:DnaK suppressor protein
MALNSAQIDHYRRILTAHREELARDTVAAERNVADQDDLVHEDPADSATASVAKDDLLGEAQRRSEILADIEAALRRIRDGVYGLCTVCGREIPTERLDAVPWTPFCIEDQEVADQRRAKAELTMGGAPSRVAR